MLAKKSSEINLKWEAFAIAIKHCTEAPTTKWDRTAVDAIKENKKLTTKFWKCQR